MPTEREANKLTIREYAEKTVLALRQHWLKQVLDWPLQDGPLAGRLTKAELTSLRRAAKLGKLFNGSPKPSASKPR